MIENNLKGITTVMFKDKHLWQYVTDDMKEKNFFIINRYLSKIYPDKAYLLNLKETSHIIGMDLWFAFMKNKPYPSSMWSKSNKEADKYSKSDIELLREVYDIKVDDVVYLMDRFPDIIKDELKHYKKVKKDEE